jgi:hypothetical protein
MISGQGPTNDTEADCPQYRDTGQLQYSNHQWQGQGCVYSTQVITLADQLGGLGLRWKGYMEDLGYDTQDQSVTCQPSMAKAPGTPDPTQHARGPNSPTSTSSTADQYALRHDPFMYFHTIIDNQAQCKADVVTLQSDSTGLRHDLQDVSTTPNLSYVVPNLCDDGHDSSQSNGTGCAAPDAKGSNNNGLPAVDDWMSIYIPMILASPAYRQDGMLVLAFDEGPTQDGSACCNQLPYDNTDVGAPQSPGSSGTGGNGGGQVGALVLSPFVKPGTTTSHNYNHFSLLRTLEDIFHTVGGDDGHGHLGLASDDPPNTSTKINPGEFGADVFTNPGYVPPPVVPTFNIPAPPLPYLPAPHSPAAPLVHARLATPAPSPQPTGSATPAATPTPVQWSSAMLAALPGQSGSGGLIAAFVLVPLLVTGGITFFLRRRGAG